MPGNSLCEDPEEAPENGSMLLQDRGNGTILAGSIAEYTCDEGYTIIGPSVKVCTEAGNWQPYQKVFCAPTEIGSIRKVY